MSDTEDKPKVKEEKSKATPVNDLKLRKNRVVSDDEDEEESQRLRGGGIAADGRNVWGF